MQQPGADSLDTSSRAAPHPAGRSRPRRTRAAHAVAGLLALPALVTALPGALGLAGRVPLAQLLPFRGALVVVLLAGAAVVLAVGGLVRLLTRGPRARTPGAAAVLAAGLVLAAAVHAGVLVARGVLPAAPPAGADLVVLSLNTEHGGASSRQVADAVGEAGADVVVLPETPATAAQEVVDLLREQHGAVFSASTATTSPEPTHATSLLLADGLGSPLPAPAPSVELAAVAATLPSLPGPVVAVHPVAPVPQGTFVQRWRADVPRAVAACSGSPGAVVAGDLNATLDHPGLRDLGPCVDAAAAAGAGGLGTWPASVPTLLAAPIDHVLVDGRAWRVLSAQVVTVGDTDHRGLVVHLARR
ncbi:endonuclease/exonuclease/phosphatase family protein [Streptomyces sp. NP160]|uniref:endonuclease/exonuclease/phosphatase family protein n=1 Tax=Streptomyces sp. NP160 TaxID=2586637 RepID=UPI00111AA68F|nr:endonuclease/exonuclease/phosphatase family protein [Streptomyces sp. NP160]TNM60031.1 endonuclease/exonuclease/phosphatase family protein [Streptomyces sp. NP160]